MCGVEVLSRINGNMLVKYNYLGFVSVTFNHCNHKTKTVKNHTIKILQITLGCSFKHLLSN